MRCNSASSTTVIDLAEVTSSYPQQSDEPTKNPTDYDLVNACELWLADTAVPESQVEDIASRPRETPAPMIADNAEAGSPHARL